MLPNRAHGGMMAEALPFDDVAPAERAESEPALLVDVDGFEGPLDLLLELARRQRVDLHRISILALAERCHLRRGGVACASSLPPTTS